MDVDLSVKPRMQVVVTNTAKQCGRLWREMNLVSTHDAVSQGGNSVGQGPLYV